jgi:hypothetical protein
VDALVETPPEPPEELDGVTPPPNPDDELAAPVMLPPTPPPVLNVALVPEPFPHPSISDTSQTNLLMRRS